MSWEAPNGRALEIGFDVGGTFVDCVVHDVQEGSWSAFKLLIRDDLESVVIRAVRRALSEAEAPPSSVSRIAHGTTVATNTVVEERGAKLGLVTTKGFRDVLELGRQERPNVFDSRIGRPAPLVPRALRLEVPDPHPPELNGELDQVLLRFRDAEIEAVVVSLLRSWHDPSQELAIAERLRSELPGVYVVAGSVIAPLMGEYERTSTAAVSAYVGPRLSGYLQSVERGLDTLGVPSPLLVMQSNGGLGVVDEVLQRPTVAQFSGPAAGVVSAVSLGRKLGERNLVTLDVGGTSADVAVLVNGEPEVTHHRMVAGVPVLGTSIGVHSIGAGGGSVAWIDGGGLLKVGPSSAGAHPGPACYGRGGTTATVTDAHLALGFIDPEASYADGLILNRQLATTALAALAEAVGRSPEETAVGILAITTSNIVRAVRRMTVEAGKDPRDFSLMAFGGGGPLYANALIRDMEMRRAIIPAGAGVACAAGLLASSLRVDVARSCPRDLLTEGYAELKGVLGELSVVATDRIRAQTSVKARIEVALSLDLRYRGQNHEITIEVCTNQFAKDSDLAAARDKFDQAHLELFGVSAPSEVVQCVVARASASLPPPVRVFERPRRSSHDRHATRALRLEEGWMQAQLITALSMDNADRVHGPALIDGEDATTVVLPGFVASLGEAGSLIVERA